MQRSKIRVFFFFFLDKGTSKIAVIKVGTLKPEILFHLCV